MKTDLTTATGFKILHALWYTPLRGPVIGIVTGTNGYETKSYIGTGSGHEEDADAIHIAENGAKFYPEVHASLPDGPLDAHERL